MRVCIYARHSSEKQCGSTQDQIDRCRRWCAERDYQIAGVFGDEAVSGAGLQSRPAIQQMIDFALESSFGGVVTEDLSRLSRDQEDIAGFFKRMQFLGIQIETLNEGIVNELHIGLKGTMNALYLKDLADKTRRGMIAAVLKGSVPGGRTYGYNLVKKMREDGELLRGLRSVNEVEASVVRDIFNAYQQGSTLVEICQALNTDDIPAPKGGHWNPSTLIGVHRRKTGLLRQTMYKGLVTFNKLDYRRNPQSGKRQSIIRCEKEWIRVPVPELAILSDDLFDTVQEEIDRRSSATPEKKQRRKNMLPEEKALIARETSRRSRARQVKVRRQPKYIISGNMSCGHCRHPVTAIRGGLYGCTNMRCHNRNLKRDTLITQTYKALKAYSLEAIKEDVKALTLKAEAIVTAKTGAEQRLKDKQEEVRNLLCVIAKNQAGRETMKYIEELELGCQKIRFEITKADLDLQSLGMEEGRFAKPEELRKKLRELVRSCEDNSKDAQAVETLNAVLKDIVVTSDRYDNAKVTVALKLDLIAL